MRHATIEELEAGLASVRAAPSDGGVIRLIVRRPAEDEREILDEGRLDRDEGLVGDDWSRRSAMRGDEAPDRYAQLTVMNSRYAALISGDGHPASWAAAGDQLYVDMDISVGNLPPGTRLALGEAVIELSAQPHTGCAKFSGRFGTPAWRLANSDEGRALRLRGANAAVVEPGAIRVGDIVRRI